MEWTAIASIVCLSIVAPLCIAGIFCPAYRDNWLQFAGLWLMAGWSVSRIEVIAGRGYTEPWNLALHAGLAFYAVGTAVKVIKHSGTSSCDDQDVPEVGRMHWPWISGGKKE